MTNLNIMLIIANAGVANGDCKKLATVDQSSAPRDRPSRPAPMIWAVTEAFDIQQTKD